MNEEELREGARPAMLWVETDACSNFLRWFFIFIVYVFYKLTAEGITQGP